MSACAIEMPIGPLSPQADESAVSAMRFGAGGALTGHAGRLEVKRKLLALEGSTILKYATHGKMTAGVCPAVFLRRQGPLPRPPTRRPLFYLRRFFFMSAIGLLWLACRTSDFRHTKRTGT